MAESPSEQPVERMPAPARPGGLCASCAHRQLVPNTRGSVFWLCRRSRVDRRYARYPRLPVLDCAGHERAGDVERDSHGDA
ncbi:MAG TPA: hypothetical protein VHU13_00755 [Solirubrobacteraceae bacterium]|nr:hypothetical protein [Solirubrobacteraceae bacterium]